MSLADKYFIENCRDIIEHGSWDTNSEVRPRWEDGTPAHTVKKFCVVNRYNLQEEFPVMTSNGLIGMVSEIAPNYAKVSTILSDEINVGVMTFDSKVTGILDNDIKNASEGNCLMSYITKNSGIKRILVYFVFFIRNQIHQVNGIFGIINREKGLS